MNKTVIICLALLVLIGTAFRHSVMPVSAHDATMEHCDDAHGCASESSMDCVSYCLVRGLRLPAPVVPLLTLLYLPLFAALAALVGRINVYSLDATPHTRRDWQRNYALDCVKSDILRD